VTRTRHRLRWATIASLTAAAVVACGEQPVEPTLTPTDTSTSPPALEIVVSSLRDTVSPGDSAAVLITLIGGQNTMAIREFGFWITGMFHDTVVVPEVTSVKGTQQYLLVLVLPTGAIQGTLVVGAYAWVAALGFEGRDSVTVYDIRPPVIGVGDWPQYMQPGLTHNFSWGARDNSRLAYGTIRMSGAVTMADSFVAPLNRQSANFGGSIAVPDTALLGDSIVAQLIAVDYHGYADTLIAPPFLLRDLTRPKLEVTLHPSPYDPIVEGRRVYAWGDTIRATVTATDNYALAWAGLRVIGAGSVELMRDSVPLSGKEAIVELESVVDTSLHTFGLVVATFARDSTGNARDLWQPQLVYNGPRRSYVEVYNGDWGTPTDFVFDDTRDRLYLTFSDLNEIAVLDPVTGMFDSPIAVPAPPLSLDLLQGDDTLVVVLSERATLALVDLTGASPVVDTLALDGIGYPDRVPQTVRITDDRRAFVSFLPDLTADSAGEYVVDFATGSQYLSDVLGGSDPRILRSGDRTSLIRWDHLYSSDYRGFSYQTESDSSVNDVIVYRAKPPTIDWAGDYYMTGDRLYDFSFNWVGTVDPECSFGASGIAADAQTAYFTCELDRGYRLVRVADGSVIEHVPLPLLYWNQGPTFHVLGHGKFLLFGLGYADPWYIVDLR